MTRKIIRYVMGFPLKEIPISKLFAKVRDNYPIGEAKPETWVKYQGKERIPISFYHRFGQTRKSLTEKSKILVFLDESLAGDVCFRRRKPYHDQWAGYTAGGVIVANVLDETAREEWNHWSNSPMEWLSDSLIREEILREKDKGRMSYRRKTL